MPSASRPTCAYSPECRNPHSIYIEDEVVYFLRRLPRSKGVPHMSDRYKLPTCTPRLGRGAALQEGRSVILYARANSGELDRLIDWLRRFAKAAGLTIN